MQKYLALTLVVSILLVNTKTSADDTNFDVTIAARFAKIWHTAPQEKVYLHTDKPYYYSAGDDIWFNAYIVNAATHT